MKKLLCHILTIFAAAGSFALLSAPAYAGETSHSVPEMRLTDVIVSALYFIGALLLIYLILTLVSRWGKKHPEETADDKTENAGEEAETSAPKKEEKGKQGEEEEKKEKDE